MVKISDLEKLKPISIRVPNSLYLALSSLSIKNRRSLSSFCRIIIEDNYLNFGKKHRYDTIHFKDSDFGILSFTMSDNLKQKIILHIQSFCRHNYNQVNFSDFIRKVLSDSIKNQKYNI